MFSILVSIFDVFFAFIFCTLVFTLVCEKASFNWFIKNSKMSVREGFKITFIAETEDS